MWFDNEWGYIQRFVDLTTTVSKGMPIPEGQIPDSTRSSIPSATVSALSSLEWSDSGEDVTITLRPGSIGIAIKDKSGLVFEVGDGQCKDQGVATGWICRE